MAKFDINKVSKKTPLVYDSYGNCGYIVKLKDCKIGEFVRLVSKRGNISSKVYVLEEYDRREKKYYLGSYVDISYGRYVKGDSLVFVGFEY